MPVLIFNESEALAAWVATQIPHVGEGGFGPCTAIGIATGHGWDAKFYGAVVFHDYQPRTGTIQVSAASLSPRWAEPGILRALLHYPFQQIRVRKLWMAIPHDNAKALQFNLHLGMVREAVLRHHFELAGWAETTIVVRFWLIAGMFVALGLGIFYVGWFPK